jgi:hypothetical protein
VVELHRFHDAGSGFQTTQLPKLMKSSTTSFRPVDVSVGPDGAIMRSGLVQSRHRPLSNKLRRSQATKRTAHLAHHGEGRAPIKQPNLAAMKPAELLAQLRSPEHWTRYQAKRLLFDAPSADVLKSG